MDVTTIRKILRECAEFGLTHNMYSPVWIMTIDQVSTHQTVHVFNRKFNNKPLHSLKIVMEDLSIHEIDLRSVSTYVYAFDIPLEATIKSFSEVVFENETQIIDKFHGYRLEMDSLNDFELEYLKEQYPGFVTYPSVFGNEWQCMCSYVNFSKDIKCEHCGRMQYENVSLIKNDYHQDLLIKHLEANPLQEGMDEDVYIDEIAFKLHISKDIVQEECNIIQSIEESKNGIVEEPSNKRKMSLKRRLVLVVVSLVILLGGNQVYANVITPYMSYQRAQSLRDDEKYDEAVLQFMSLGTYRDAEKQAQFTLVDKVVSLIRNDRNEYFEISNTLNNSKNIEDIREYANSVVQKLREQKDYKVALTLMGLLSSEYNAEIYTEAAQYYEGIGDLENATMMHMMSPNRDDEKIASMMLRYLRSRSHVNGEWISGLELNDITLEDIPQIFLNNLLSLSDKQEYKDYIYEYYYRIISYMKSEGTLHQVYSYQLKLLADADYKDAKEILMDTGWWDFSISFHSDNPVTPDASSSFQYEFHINDATATVIVDVYGGHKDETVSLNIVVYNDGFAAQAHDFTAKTGERIVVPLPTIPSKDEIFNVSVSLHDSSSSSSSSYTYTLVP